MEEKKTVSVPFLIGKRTRLRIIRPSDLETILYWINDTEVNRNLLVTHPIYEAREAEWIANLGKDQNNILLGIETVEGVYIGNMGLHGINHLNGTATTGTMIGEKKYWGQGYGTDAKMIMLDYAFNRLNLRKVCSSVLDFNARSLAYAAKCGYISEGIRRAHIYREGAYHDEHLLAVFRKAWEPRWAHYQLHGTMRGYETPTIADLRRF